MFRNNENSFGKWDMYEGTKKGESKNECLKFPKATTKTQAHQSQQEPSRVLTKQRRLAASRTSKFKTSEIDLKIAH